MFGQDLDEVDPECVADRVGQLERHPRPTPRTGALNAQPQQLLRRSSSHLATSPRMVGVVEVINMASHPDAFMPQSNQRSISLSG